MAKKNIKVYARIKPERYKKSALFETQVKSGKEEIVIYPPRPMNQSIGSSPFKYKFTFDKIFRANCDQIEIFQTVAVPILDQIKSGSNGTIFAYGQTGSGKTYTMLGSILNNCHRGMIPRILQNLFYDKRTMRISLSYLEIYKDVGIDLLSRNCQKVVVQESEEGIHLKNLQKVCVQNMDEVIKILQIGEDNRKISCTKYNTRSSRSHCILTIRYEGSFGDKVIQSYFHLVDLAGSERFKAHLRLNDESIHINKSLHFLEVVVNALTYPTMRHIPYRNCLVTSVLKDSLNANSFTSMIATLSLTEENALETLSSCRFASRMSRMKSSVIETIKPSRIDTKTQILSLQDEVQRLHGLLINDSQVKAVCYNNVLTDEDKRYCENVVAKFLAEDNDSLSIPVTEPKHIHECFRIIRKRVKQFQKQFCNDDSKLIVRKNNYETTYNEDYALKSCESNQFEHRENYNKSSYDDRPIRTSLLVPVQVNKRNIGTTNKTKVQMRKIDRGTINFDEYLENNLYKSNSSRSLNKSNNSSIATSSNRSNKENDFISVSRLGTKSKSPGVQDIDRKNSENNVVTTYRPLQAKNTKCLPWLHDKSVEHPGPNYYPVSARDSSTQNSVRSQSNRTRQYGIIKTNTRRLQDNNLPSAKYNVHDIQNIISEIIKTEFRKLFITDDEPKKLESPAKMLMEPPLFSSTECEPINFEEPLQDDPIPKNEVNICKSITSNIQKMPSKEQLADQKNHNIEQKPLEGTYIIKDHVNDYTFVKSSSVPNLGNYPAHRPTDQRAQVSPNIEQSRSVPSTFNSNHQNVNLGSLQHQEMHGDYLHNNRYIARPFNIANPSEPLVQSPLNHLVHDSNTFESRVHVPKSLEQQPANTSSNIEIINQTSSITKTENISEEPHPFSSDRITQCPPNSNHIHDVFKLNTNLPILNHNNVLQHEQCSPWEPISSLNVCADNNSQQKHYILPGTESKVPLTGDKEIDEEIIKFYKCRELAKLAKL